MANNSYEMIGPVRPNLGQDPSKFVGWLDSVRDWTNEPAVEAAEADRIWQDQHSARQNLFSAEQAELAWKRNQQSAREAMAFEANQARINREWQEEMSSTAYQRQIADLKKAGINPIFALNGGGASTPSGATASGSAGYASPAQGTSARGAQANVSTSFLRDIIMSAVSVASAVGSITKSISSSKLAGKIFELDSKKFALEKRKYQHEVDTYKHLDTAFKKYRRRAYMKGYYSGAMDSDQFGDYD